MLAYKLARFVCGMEKSVKPMTLRRFPHMPAAGDAAVRQAGYLADPPDRLPDGLDFV
jgi:hypothetical protein